MLDALIWYVVVQATALAVWPLAARALAPLADRGWAAAKVLGILSLAWLVWLVCMLTSVPFSRGTLLVGLLGIAAVGWLGIERRLAPTDMRAWLWSHRVSLVAWEGLFLIAFGLFAVLRAYQPAAAGTEKPMDMAFLNGFISATRLPTQDTWLAGYAVPYYHFGYFILACVAKLAAVPPGVAYNLAAASVPALATVTLASLAWTLARAAHARPGWAAAGVGVATLLVIACGNLSTFFEWLASRGVLTPEAGEVLGIKGFAQSVLPGVWPPLDAFWWFHASRVLPNLQPDGINEFPFFSAYLSDLHPHFVALPFEALALSLGVAHVLSRGTTLRSPWTQAACMLALGGLLVLNTWDIAPFWLLYVGLIVICIRVDTWRSRLRWAVLGPLGGLVLYAPYFVGYAGPPLGLGIVTERTPFGSLLVLFGPHLLLLAGLGLAMRAAVGQRRGWMVAAGGALAGGALALVGEPTLGLLVALVALLLPWPGVVERLHPAEAATVGVAAFAAVMLLGVELIFLDDVFHSRMNTVFKFHENVWLLAGLAGGVGLALLAARLPRARWPAVAAAGCVVLAGLVYPASAIATRLAERPLGGPTLDATAFLPPDDAAGVRWLRTQNALLGERAVIVEAVGGAYTSAARMATYSGAAAVLGWVGHQQQWRGPLPELTRRESDIAALYRDAPLTDLRPLLARYSVTFVIVGDLERQHYGPDVDSRFENVLPMGFRSGRLTIYRTN